MNSAILILALFLLQQPPTNPAITVFGVTLQWDANPEPDLTGYRVYYGQASRTYGTPVTLGKVTTYKVEGLTTPGVYYFAVTALNAAGESGYSNEVVLQPGPAGPQGPIGPAGPQGLPASEGTGACAPPCIGFVGVSGLTTTTATIIWQTVPECSGKVLWGVTAALDRVTVANNLGTADHLVLLTGLASRTHYLYQAVSVCPGAGTLAGIELRGPVKSFNTK